MCIDVGFSSLSAEFKISSNVVAHIRTPVPCMDHDLRQTSLSQCWACVFPVLCRRLIDDDPKLASAADVMTFSTLTNFPVDSDATSSLLVELMVQLRAVLVKCILVNLLGRNLLQPSMAPPQAISFVRKINCDSHFNEAVQ